jgi:branched-chain amino acid transport system ATP-binding protein
MLQVDRISVHYGGAPALCDVTMRVDVGELVCIVGPNGAGKSTLINAIAGLNRISTGELKLSGRDLTQVPVHRFCREGIAIVPEGRRLFSRMSVRENLELGSLLPDARARRAESLERMCELFPMLPRNLNRQAGALSGGQQQVVAIARALMARPRLLLLDEPSLGLAPMIVRELFQAVERVNREGTAILLVEQNVPAALDLAARAYVLDEGRIIAEGAPAALRAQPDIRRAYLGIGAAEAR